MELTNDFRVGVPVERAWAVLTDVELIAPCMPGAQLQEVEGDEYRGIVKVKVGPITAQYKGAARFVEKDDVAHKAVLRAEGRDTRGQGNANATITATLTPDGDGTAVTVATDLTVTGRVAQFGRGVMADVSTKIMGEFARRLEESLAESRPDSDTGNAEDEPAETKPAEIPGAGAPAPAGEPQISPETSRARTVVQTEVAEPVDLMAIAGPSVLRRQGVPVALAGVLALLAITNGRGKRLGLAAVGIALVAATVVAERRR